MITSIESEKSFDKFQHKTVTINSLNKLGTERNFLSLIKGNYKKPTANVIING